MNKFWGWFSEVFEQFKLWWGLGVAICIFEGVSTYLKVGLIGASIYSFAKALLIMFIIAPLLIGTVAYFIKGKQPPKRT